MKWVLYAFSLAIGEFLASLLCNGGHSWPFSATAALLTALIGYGRAIRGWGFVFWFFLGASVFSFAGLEREADLRERPWMRDYLRYARRKNHSWFVDARKELSRRVGIGLEHSPDIAGLNRAILLGERWKMPLEIRHEFIEAGTIHVFAISGLHVMTVARLLMIFAAMCFVPYRWQGAVVLPILWVYVGIVGWSASAVRAAVMASIVLGAPFVWRKPDLLRAWVVAFMGMHIVNPLWIEDVGCRLSFTVMLALALAARVPIKVWFLERLFVGLVAWLAGAPIVWWVFGRVPMSSMIANLVLIPAAEISVIAGFLGAIVSFVNNSVAAHLNNFAALFTLVMVAISKICK